MPDGSGAQQGAFGGGDLGAMYGGGSGGGGGQFDWSALLGGLGGMAGGIGQLFGANQANQAGQQASNGMQSILSQMFGQLNGQNGIMGQLQNFQLPQALIHQLTSQEMGAGQNAVNTFMSQAGGMPNMPMQAQRMMQGLGQQNMQSTVGLGADAAQMQLQALMGAGNMGINEANTALSPYEMAYQQSNQNAQQSQGGWGNVLSGLAQFAPLLGMA